MENTDGISREFAHIPIKKLFQAVRLEHKDIQRRQDQKDRSLDQNPSRDREKVIQRVGQAPMDPDLPRGDQKQRYPQSAVTERRKPIGVHENDLKQQPPRTQNKSVKAAAADGVSKIAKPRKENDHNSVCEE